MNMEQINNNKNNIKNNDINDDINNTESINTIIKDKKCNDKFDIKNKNSDNFNNDAPSELYTQISDLQNQLSKQKDQYIRLAADFDNYKKRSIKNIEEIRKYSLEGIILDLLEVIDNFERATSSFKEIKENKQIQSFTDGIFNIKKQFMNILESYGLKKIDVNEGNDFNPHFHEAIQHIRDNNVKDGTITKIIKEGYLLNSKVLRPTLVIVSKNEQ